VKTKPTKTKAGTSKSEAVAPNDHSFNGFRVAMTERGRGLVAFVLQQLAALEEHDAHVGGSTKRTRARRSADQRRYEQQVEALTTDLAYRHLRDPGVWLFTSRSKAVLSKRSRYAPQFITEKITDVMDAMSRGEVGLCQLRIAPPHSARSGPTVAQSTLRAGKALVLKIAELGLTMSDFGINPTEEVIILKRAKDDRRDAADWMEYEDTAETIAMRERLQIVNCWLADSGIDYEAVETDRREHAVDPTQRRLRRVFINGSFEQHGRMYGGFWINLGGRERLECVTIDGDPVSEVDFGQVSIRLLYAEASQRPHFEDAYAVPGLEKYREGVKTVINAMLTSPKPLTRLPQGVRKLIPPVIQVDGQWVKLDFPTVEAMILNFHAPVRGWFSQAHSQRLNFRESQIMVSVLLALIEQRITALPIHDGLLVASQHAETAKSAMLTAFRDATGFEGVVSIDHG
jgi:hypothetical protein